MTYFVMALALVLGFTQCKKEQVNTPENETKTVNITLNVGGNGGGSRHDINTTTGAVDFKNGDVIYVGNGSTYIGTLTRNSDVFSGNIIEPADGTEIYFYFVGGLTTDPADLSGQSSFTVNISDQTTKLPVLSLNQATYHTNVTDYSCELKNQCGLVKFRTNVASGTVSVGGMNTVATITFGSNTITAGTSGAVSFATDGDGNGWAILLMQDGVDEATVTADGYFDGKCDVPEITRNMWYNEGVEVSLEPKTINLSEVSGDKTIQDGYTVTGTLGAEVKISIADGATVTLDGVSINAEGTWKSGNYAGITCLGNATLILKDGSTNTVKGFNWNYPGIYVPDVPEGSTLIIKGGAAGTGKLTASSNGYGAGIGGGYDEGDYEISCGNIEIQGGDITATGGEQAAGIGSGSDFASCGTITISGGTVTANGGSHAAGIGSGSSSGAVCGDITITTDVTQVTATKVDGAPYSIGAGVDGTCDGTVTIGGVVFYDATNGYQNGYQALLQNSSFSVPPFSFTLTFGYEGSGDTESHVFLYGETWEHLCHTSDAWRESIIMGDTWHVAKGQTTYVIQISDNGSDWETLEFNDENGHVIDPSKQYRWFNDEEPGGEEPGGGEPVPDV